MKAEDFKEELKIIREAGFNPIAVGKKQGRWCKCFLFSKELEAVKAFGKLDTMSRRGSLAIDGLWYGKDAVDHKEVDWLYL